MHARENKADGFAGHPAAEPRHVSSVAQPHVVVPCQ
jgi:hypothetical protein